MPRIRIHLTNGKTITTWVDGDQYSDIQRLLEQPNWKIEVTAHDVHERIPTIIPVRAVVVIQVIEQDTALSLAMNMPTPASLLNTELTRSERLRTLVRNAISRN